MTPTTETYLIRTVDHQRRIHAIRFLRFLTAFRDEGNSIGLGLAEAKRAVDNLLTAGTPIAVENLPRHAIPLINLAAEAQGVNESGRTAARVTRV